MKVEVDEDQLANLIGDVEDPIELRFILGIGVLSVDTEQLTLRGSIDWMEESIRKMMLKEEKNEGLENLLVDVGLRDRQQTIEEIHDRLKEIEALSQDLKELCSEFIA